MLLKSTPAFEDVTFFSFETRIKEVAQAQETNFPTSLPQPLRDHDIHPPLRMINSCL